MIPMWGSKDAFLVKTYVFERKTWFLDVHGVNKGPQFKFFLLKYNYVKTALQTRACNISLESYLSVLGSVAIHLMITTSL